MSQPKTGAPGWWRRRKGAALLPAAVRLDKASGGALTRALKFSRFTGKAGQFLEVLAPSGLKASRILLVGLGKPESLDEKGLETVGRPDRGPAVRGWVKLRPIIEIDVPKGSKVKKGEAGGASGLRRPSEKLCFRQVSHPQSG